MAGLWCLRAVLPVEGASWGWRECLAQGSGGRTYSDTGLEWAGRSGRAGSGGGSHMVFLRISEWMRATPLTACDPAMHRWAMLMRFTAPSSTSDMRRSRSTSPGKAAATRCARRAQS